MTDVNHFHITKAPSKPVLDEATIATPLDLADGTYSRVGTSQTEFEWDGWKQQRGS